MPPIPEDIVELLEGGVSILVGTRDAESRPEVARAVGCSVSRDRREVTIYLHEAWGAKALVNLQANREIAVGFSRPLDNFAIQLKGKCTQFVPASEGDRTTVDRYHATYGEQLYMTGFPRSTTRRFIFWPAVAVTFGVRDIFVQTPGPDAGKRLEGPAR
ncbi:MAG: hypothetical protein JWO86_9248 [Myxococcaceae bacterium]|nr:hypothetical protein [Myxococcaceae bacterium]